MRRLLLHLAVGTAVPALVLSLGASTGASAAAPTAANRFAPVSASFVSAGTGFVLGTRGCARSSCAARLVKTTNGGRTWTALPAPAVPLTGPRQATRTVRFADSGNGWLFNPGLWATHNGGRHWQRIYLPGTVVAMAASAGTVLASVSPYTGGPSRLYQSPAGTSRWTLVPGVVPAGHLTLYGHAGWAGSEPGLWGTTDLRHWHKLPPLKCPSIYTFKSLAASSASRILVLCTGNAAAGSEGKLVYASTNGGLTFRKVGPAPLNGDGGTLATPPGRPLIVTLATSSAASMLDRSVNGGRTWTQTMYVDNGIGWRDLAYVTSTTGWIIHGSAGFPAYAALMRTVNSGASWKTVPIP